MKSDQPFDESDNIVPIKKAIPGSCNRADGSCLFLFSDIACLYFFVIRTCPAEASWIPHGWFLHPCCQRMYRCWCVHHPVHTWNRNSGLFWADSHRPGLEWFFPDYQILPGIWNTGIDPVHMFPTVAAGDLYQFTVFDFFVFVHFFNYISNTLQCCFLWMIYLQLYSIFIASY